MSQRAWMVRASGGEILEQFLENSIAALGWEDVGDLTKATSRELVAEKVQEIWPDNPPGRNAVWTGMLHRFRNVVEPGETVITYDPQRRVYHVGKVESDYRFDPELDDEFPNIRDVAWESTIDRDDLSVTTKNELGCTLTLFKLSETASSEMHGLASGEPIEPSDDVETGALDEEELLRDIQARSREFIKDRLIRISWEQMQELVAGLLRAMGYKTKVSPRGSDLGRDIVASPDGLGLEQPRIVVEVKHRNQSIGSQEIRGFLGGRHKDDKGLYVSTGGFTKDARYEADRASIPITLMNLDDLVSAIIEHYEDMDMDTRVLVPLVNVYWPA